jgi:hypothetical protein
MKKEENPHLPHRLLTRIARGKKSAENSGVKLKVDDVRRPMIVKLKSLIPTFDKILSLLMPCR